MRPADRTRVLALTTPISTPNHFGLVNADEEFRIRSHAMQTHDRSGLIRPEATRLCRYRRCRTCAPWALGAWSGGQRWPGAPGLRHRRGHSRGFSDVLREADAGALVIDPALRRLLRRDLTPQVIARRIALSERSDSGSRRTRSFTYGPRHSHSDGAWCWVAPGGAWIVPPSTGAVRRSLHLTARRRPTSIRCVACSMTVGLWAKRASNCVRTFQNRGSDPHAAGFHR